MLEELLLSIDWQKERSYQAFAAERNYYGADVRG